MASNPRKTLCTPSRVGCSHCETAGAELEFPKSEEPYDVTFLVGEEAEEIKFHKAFLISRSSVFERMFSETWDESKKPVALEDVHPKAFRAFLEFIYTDEVPKNVQMAIQVLQIGDKYAVKVLVEECKRLLMKNLELENAIQIFCVARLHSLNNLIDEAGDLMTSSFLQLSQHPSFNEMDKETLIYLLKRDDLILLESELFKIVLSWARRKVGGDAEENCSYAGILKEVLPLIRFPLMNTQELSIAVIPAHVRHGVLSKEEIMELSGYFSTVGWNRAEREMKIKFSATPRKMPLRVNLYRCSDRFGLTDEFRPEVESLDSHFRYEEILDTSISYRTEMSNAKSVAKLASVWIHGPNLDPLQQYWPPNEALKSEYTVRVCIEVLEPDLVRGSIANCCTRDCIIRKGVESVIEVEPKMELPDGKVLRIKVAFLVSGNVGYLTDNIPSSEQPIF